MMIIFNIKFRMVVINFRVENHRHQDDNGFIFNFFKKTRDLIMVSDDNDDN